MVQVRKRAKVVAPACCDRLAGLLSPRLFKAFADPKRLALLVRLASSRVPCTVRRAAEGSGVDLSVVSRHLAVLREAGVIECARRGKEVFCVVRTSAVARLLRDLADALEACCPDGLSLDREPPAPTARTAAPSRTRRPRRNP